MALENNDMTNIQSGKGLILKKKIGKKIHDEVPKVSGSSEMRTKADPKLDSSHVGFLMTWKKQQVNVDIIPFGFQRCNCPDAPVTGPCNQCT